MTADTMYEEAETGEKPVMIDVEVYRRQVQNYLTMVSVAPRLDKKLLFYV